MTKQTKIATQILERAYARELIKVAIGQSDFGAGSYTPPGQPKPANSALTAAGKTLEAAGTATGNFFGHAGHGIYGAAHGLGGNLFGAGARIGQGLSYGNYALTGNKRYLNDADARGAAARSFESNARAGWHTALEAPSRMFSALDGPTPIQTLQAQQGAKLGPSEQALFNTANGAAEMATGTLATGPAFGAASKVLPSANNGMLVYGLGNTIYQNAGGAQLGRVLANTVGMGNQAQAAEPQSMPQLPAEPAGVNYNDLADDLNGGRPYGGGNPGMHNAANEFAAENNTDQTEVAQDAAATPAQPAAAAVEQPAPAQPAAEQPSDMATDYANLEPAKWTLPPNATPEQQQTVKDATNTINAAPPPVQQAVVARNADPTNEEAKATIDAAATENIVRSVTEDPAATANGATDFGALIGAKMEWYNKQDPHTQGLLALGLSAGVIGLISAINGGGLGSFLSMALGLGGAGLLGAAAGAFGEDGQRAMGQGMASVGRMMGMDVPTDPVSVDRLVGENAPATIHADIMKQAPTLEEKMRLFASKSMRDARAQNIRAELKQLDRAKQIAGLPEHAAVPLLMHLGQADKKPISLEVAKQVYRNAVQTVQMANDKDSPMAKQIAMGQQFAADPDAYVKPYQQAAGSALELGKMTNVGRLADWGSQGANWAYDKYKNLKW